MRGWGSLEARNGVQRKWWCGVGGREGCVRRWGGVEEGYGCERVKFEEGKGCEGKVEWGWRKGRGRVQSRRSEGGVELRLN